MKGVLGKSFYCRPAKNVAADLLGKAMVRDIAGQRVAGIVVEAEAYCDADEPDLACHGDRANNGHPTRRTEVMFGPAGHAYVYFTYGMHWMFNIVTGREGEANAVLVRALEPIEGYPIMSKNRPGKKPKDWTSGPAKLAQAMEIDKSFNGANLYAPESVIWFEQAQLVKPHEIATGPRIGLGKTPEPWLSIPWRYWIRDNSFISR